MRVFGAFTPPKSLSQYAEFKPMYVIMYVFTVLSGHGKSKVPKYLKPFTLKAIGVNGLNFLEDFL